MRPSQTKTIVFPTIHFQGRAVSFTECPTSFNWFGFFLQEKCWIVLLRLPGLNGHTLFGVGSLNGENGENLGAEQRMHKKPRVLTNWHHMVFLLVLTCIMAVIALSIGFFEWPRLCSRGNSFWNCVVVELTIFRVGVRRKRRQSLTVVVSRLSFSWRPTDDAVLSAGMK